MKRPIHSRMVGSSSSGARPDWRGVTLNRYAWPSIVNDGSVVSPKRAHQSPRSSASHVSRAVGSRGQLEIIGKGTSPMKGTRRGNIINLDQAIDAVKRDR